MIVSVVIPVYNDKPYLERCVQSVLNQTYKDLEIVLVDDGSTDGTGDLCDQLASVDLRICVIHQENKGLSGARNVGIRKATGEYIVFLDSDDEWLQSDGLEKLLAGEKTDLIIFKRVDFWSKGRRVAGADYDIEMLTSMPDTQAVFSHLVKTQQLQISACFLLVRRHVLLDYDLFFPIGLYSEDVHWSMRLWQHVEKVRFVNLNFYAYYHREARITTTADIRSFHSYDHIFTYWKAQCEANCKNAGAIRAYMANLWVSRGYSYHIMNKCDKAEALRILKKHTDLLKYGCSPKSRRIKKLVDFFGVRATAVVLGWYWRIRCFLKH